MPSTSHRGNRALILPLQMRCGGIQGPGRSHVIPHSSSQSVTSQPVRKLRHRMEVAWLPVPLSFAVMGRSSFDFQIPCSEACGKANGMALVVIYRQECVRETV